MRRAARTDATQKPIVAALRKCGWTWVDLSRVGDGCPDGLAIKKGRVRLVECKTDTGKLTPAQVQFHADSPEPIYILRSVEDAVRLR